MKHPYESTLNDGYNPYNECEKMIRRVCPGLMKAGGGPLIKDNDNCRPFTLRASTVAKRKDIIELGKTGLYSATDIARLVSKCRADVSSVLRREGIVVPDGRPAKSGRRKNGNSSE